jgi:hypothetical protein
VAADFIGVFEVSLDVSTMLDAAVRGTHHVVLKGTAALVLTELVV